MKRSATPTEYIIVKAAVSGEFNACDFALIHITAGWKETMRQRMELAAQFKGVPHFSRVTFYDCNVAFYENNEYFSVDEILGKHEDWAYILLAENETDNLVECDNHLNGFLLHLDELGSAFYSANAEYTGEEYYSDDFPVSQLTDTKC